MNIIPFIIKNIIPRNTGLKFDPSGCLETDAESLKIVYNLDSASNIGATLLYLTIFPNISINIISSSLRDYACEVRKNSFSYFIADCHMSVQAFHKKRSKAIGLKPNS